MRSSSLLFAITLDSIDFRVGFGDTIVEVTLANDAASSYLRMMRSANVGSTSFFTLRSLLDDVKKLWSYVSLVLMVLLKLLSNEILWFLLFLVLFIIINEESSWSFLSVISIYSIQSNYFYTKYPLKLINHYSRHPTTTVLSELPLAISLPQILVSFTEPWWPPSLCLSSPVSEFQTFTVLSADPAVTNFSSELQAHFNKFFSKLCVAPIKHRTSLVSF